MSIYDCVVCGEFGASVRLAGRGRRTKLCETHVNEWHEYLKASPTNAWADVHDAHARLAAAVNRGSEDAAAEHASRYFELTMVMDDIAKEWIEKNTKEKITEAARS